MYGSRSFNKLCARRRERLGTRLPYSLSYSAPTRCTHRRVRQLQTVSRSSASIWPPLSTTSSSWEWCETRWRSKRSTSPRSRSCWNTNCFTKHCLPSAQRLSSSPTIHTAGKQTGSSSSNKFGQFHYVYHYGALTAPFVMTRWAYCLPVYMYILVIGP